MKLFKNIMSRKPDPEEMAGKIDLDMDVEPLRRRDEATADDSGRVNSSLGARAGDPLYADPAKPIRARAEEPEEADGAGWGANAWAEDEWDDEDEDWGDEDLDDEADEAGGDDRALLMKDIRGAVDAVDPAPRESVSRPVSAARPMSSPRPASTPRPWAEDTDFGRKAIARSQLGGGVDGAEDRLLNETNSKMTDRESSRRRSAMAHLKAAAQATKADRVLQHVASRDPAADPEEQSPYRDDLAKVVRPRSTSRPISRPVTRPRSQSAAWDESADDDAALFAAASEDALGRAQDEDFDDEDRAAREERLARAPADLSADEFADDSFYDADEDDALDDDFEDNFGRDAAAAPAAGAAESDWSSRFASDDESDNAFDFDDENEDEDDGFDEDDADEDGPVPSSVVSDVVALANEQEDSGSAIDDAAVRRKIAEMNLAAAQGDEPKAEDIVNVAAAVTGRAGRSAGRVKTRLLGFQAADAAPKDVFETAVEATQANQTQYPVGWIVVVEGPGRGACFTMYNGVSNIGRGEDQAVRLDFGDTSISRHNHAAVAYDDEQGKFYLGHGGKSNLVRLNGRPVLSTEDMASGDQIRIGETTLKFVALCGEEFTWGLAGESEGNDD